MIAVTRRILISAPRESIRMYLQDIKNVAQYEQKVDAVEVTSQEADRVQALVSGKFLGLSWKGAFDVRLTGDGGYHAELTQGSIKRMACSFHLRAVKGGTVLTHEEQYHFSFLTRPVMRLFKGWLGQTMELELGVIKEEAERVSRRLHLSQIENV
jgi:hypothetical protein